MDIQKYRKRETREEMEGAMSLQERRLKEPIEDVSTRRPIDFSLQEIERTRIKSAFTDFVKKPITPGISTDISQFGYNLFAGTPVTFAPTAMATYTLSVERPRVTFQPHLGLMTAPSTSQESKSVLPDCATHLL